MNELVVAIFKDFVTVDVLDVEMGVKSKPLLILAFIFDAFLEILFQRVELLVNVLKEVVYSLLPPVVVVITRHRNRKELDISLSIKYIM